MTSLLRNLMGILMALSVLAIAAAPAHARFTPVNGNFSATASDSVFTDEGTGLRTRCPLSIYAGSVNGAGSALIGTLTFTSSGGVTCTESLFGSSATVSCRGITALASTGSTAGSRAIGDALLETGWECTTRSLAGTRTIRGPQTPTNCTWAFSQSTQILTIACNTIAVDGGGEVGFAGSYRFGTRLTIS